MAYSRLSRAASRFLSLTRYRKVNCMSEAGNKAGVRFETAGRLP
jgi:hypothetical protein